MERGDTDAEGLSHGFRLLAASFSVLFVVSGDISLIQALFALKQVPLRCSQSCLRGRFQALQNVFYRLQTSEQVPAEPVLGAWADGSHKNMLYQLTTSGSHYKPL